MTEEIVTKGMDEKFCESCGNIIKIRAEICPKCGVRLLAAAKGKSKAAAILLALFLGGIGFHKFYLGQTGMGIIYLIFFWTGLPMIVGFIEGIWYITLSDEEFAARFSGVQNSISGSQPLEEDQGIFGTNLNWKQILLIVAILYAIAQLVLIGGM